MHSLVQDFFFDEEFMLRRHDCNVNIAGEFGAAQLTSNRAYARGPDRRPILDMLLVAIDISDIKFS